MSETREQAVHAVRLLNYFVGDLVTGVRVREIFLDSKLTESLQQGTTTCINRMCLAHLFLTLHKIGEFYDRFHRLVPASCRAEFKALRNQIRERGISEFRNKSLGHIWDNEADRPLLDREVQQFVDRIVGNDILAFLGWCNNSVNEFPETVVSIVEHGRDRICEEHEITDSELQDRAQSRSGGTVVSLG